MLIIIVRTVKINSFLPFYNSLFVHSWQFNELSSLTTRA